MQPFPSPNFNATIGGYPDATRPHGTRAQFPYGWAEWRLPERQWYPIANPPVWHVQQASPSSSPSTTTTIPINPTYLTPLAPAIPQGRLAPPWPALMPVAIPNCMLTAKQLLELSPPIISRDGRARAVVTTHSRDPYPSLRRIHPLQWPNDLAGYTRLPDGLMYHYLEEDPTLWLDVEADAIWACKNYIVSPVNIVLQKGFSFPIRSTSENTKSVEITQGQDVVHHLSRLDLGWDVCIGGSWVTFAVLEFKRPYALKHQEWASALAGQGPVTGTGEKICRQVVKYAYHRNTPFVAACDWETLILLRIHGEKSSWYGGQAYAAGIDADGVQLTSQVDFKRALWVWLRMALGVKLAHYGLNLYSQP